MNRLLLCPPDFYGIEYEINPWMHLEQNVQKDLAQAQWEQLRETLLKFGCQIELIEPQHGLPDMVFTANAGVVAGRRIILSNFRFKERQGEAAHFEKWFAEHDYEIVKLPKALSFEGEGDTLFCGDNLFCAYRFRSDIQAHERFGELLQRAIFSVELIDPRFYHLDTCFCPLPDGGAIWFPDAFNEPSQKIICEHCKKLIEVSPQEAACFACNAVVLGHEILLPELCPKLYQQLGDEGYHCHLLSMTEFIKSGGACKCLTLFLEH